MNIAAQAVGAIALICAVASFWRGSHRRILVLRLLSTGTFCSGAYTGALLNAVAR